MGFRGADHFQGHGIGRFAILIDFAASRRLVIRSMYARWLAAFFCSLG